MAIWRKDEVMYTALMDLSGHISFMTTHRTLSSSFGNSSMNTLPGTKRTGSVAGLRALAVLLVASRTATSSQANSLSMHQDFCLAIQNGCALDVWYHSSSF